MILSVDQNMFVINAKIVLKVKMLDIYNHIWLKISFFTNIHWFLNRSVCFKLVFYQISYLLVWSNYLLINMFFFMKVFAYLLYHMVGQIDHVKIPLNVGVTICNVSNWQKLRNMVDASLMLAKKTLIVPVGWPVNQESVAIRCAHIKNHANLV